MRTLWKFQLEITDEQSVKMPDGAVIRAVDVQDGWICVWAEVDSKNPPVVRTFAVVGTGNPLPGYRTYLGMVVMPPFVWHVYEC